MDSTIPPEVLASLAAIKGVFSSARGPKVIQLQKDVACLEKYLHTKQNYPVITETAPQDLNLGSQVMAEIWEKVESDVQEPELLEFIPKKLLQGLNADRVVIYRFLNNHRATAIAEARKANCNSLLTQNLPHNAFGLDVFQEQLSTMPHVYELTPSQLDFWHNFQVLSGLVVPIISEQEIWGIIKIHHCLEKKSGFIAEKHLLAQVSMILRVFIKSQLNKSPNPGISEAKTTIQEELLDQVNEKIDLSVDSCQELFLKLMALQKKTLISSQNLGKLITEYQDLKKLLDPIETLKDSLEILSVNTAIQATQKDTEEELISIAQQVELITSQARDTTTHIEKWLQDLNSTTEMVNLDSENVEMEFRLVAETVEKTQQQLQNLSKIMN